jgi:hypothetical protein
MIVSKKHLDRRTFLRGASTVLALPLLDAMIPALRPERLTAAMPVRRLGFVMYPMGVVVDKWKPVGDGPGYQISPALAPLAPFREKFIIMSGLVSSPDRTKTDFHDRAMASYMTGCEPTTGKVYVGISVDQVAAQTLGRETAFASLEMSTQAMQYHGGPCYKTATQNLPMEKNPRVVFERLFGDTDTIDPEASARRNAEDRSILDDVVARISDLKKTLGISDRRKLDDYVESIRDVERRIQMTLQNKAPDLPESVRPAGIPDSWPEHVKLMFDLQALALQADLTRVWTFLYNSESSLITYPHLGISMQHHEISHHNFETEKLNALHKINVHQSELFAYFLGKLESITEGNSTLLDHSLVVYGSDLSVPTIHSQHDLPIIVAGGAAGRVSGGRYVKHEGEPPLTNLYLSLLDKVGVPTEKLGDSTGRLNRLEV